MAIAGLSSDKAYGGCGFWRWPSPSAGHGGKGRRAAGLRPLLQTLGPVALFLVLASGAGKPSEQILCRLLWLEAANDATMGGGPLNKIQAHADSCSCKIQALLHLLAGRGGEEKVVMVGMLCSYWSRLAHCPAGGLRSTPFLLTGRGGMGEDCGGGMMLGGWWWLGVLLEDSHSGDAICCKLTSLILYSGHHESYAYCWKYCHINLESALANLYMLEIRELLLNGFTVAISMPVRIDYHQRRARARCLLICKEMVLLYMKPGCYTSISYHATGHSVFAFFVLLGCIRRRQMRESPNLLPRFSGKDFFDLSSVMLPLDLQLDPKPQSCLPTRLSVEPLALRLVRFQEALGEYNCRFFCPISHRIPDVYACVCSCRQCWASKCRGL
jgi:hypothetical protein